MAGCKKCGSGGTRTVAPSASAGGNTSSDMVLIDYIGTQEQKRRLRSKVKPQEQYVFSGDSRRFLAYRKDAEWLASMLDQFKIVTEPTIELAGAFEDVPVLTSVARAVPAVPAAPIETTTTADMPLDVLTIDPITLALLKKNFQTITELRNVGRSGWMTIKGIGASRADMVAEALNAL